jgi:hypothetical protein
MDYAAASLKRFVTSEHNTTKTMAALGVWDSPYEKLPDILAWQRLYTRQLFFRVFFFRRTKASVPFVWAQLEPKNEVVVFVGLDAQLTLLYEELSDRSWDCDFRGGGIAKFNLQSHFTRHLEECRKSIHDNYATIGRL